MIICLRCHRPRKTSDRGALHLHNRVYGGVTVSTKHAPHRENETPTTLEIYIDLRVVPDESTLYRDQPLEDSASHEPTHGHWTLTDALISRGAGEDTGLPSAPITDRPIRLRRRPSMWARRRRNFF